MDYDNLYDRYMLNLRMLVEQELANRLSNASLCLLCSYDKIYREIAAARLRDRNMGRIASEDILIRGYENAIIVRVFDMELEFILPYGMIPYDGLEITLFRQDDVIDRTRVNVSFYRYVKLSENHPISHNTPRNQRRVEGLPY